MAALLDTRALMVRELLVLWRQPWWIVVTLVQPIVWLLLFGSLFESVTEIPGFTGDFRDYLAPGVVVMTAFFTSGWSGMGTINDLDRGITNRLLVTPVGRVSILAGRISQAVVIVLIQSLLVVGLSLAIGASFPGGAGGVLVLLAVSVVLAAAVAAFSNGLALHARKEETVIGVLSFIQLPLSFLSTAFMQEDLVPGWIATASDLNPFNWAVEAGRQSALGVADTGEVLLLCGLLLAFCVACWWFAVSAFRSYAKSV